MARFPVLMYHRIESVSCPVDDPEERRYAVTLDVFRAQLGRLRDSGKRGVSMREVHDRLEAGTEIPRDWVAITFDDGNRSDYEHAAGDLRDAGFTATFYVTGNRIDAAGGLDSDMIVAMKRDGLHFGGHGMTHRFLSALSAGDEKEEVTMIRKRLGDLLGEDIDHFAPPGGRYSARTLHVLRDAGYRAVGTSAFGLNRSAGRRFTYRRLPVMRDTTLEQFDRLTSGRVLDLAGGYVRAGALSVARRLLGESAYRRVRSLGTGS